MLRETYKKNIPNVREVCPSAKFIDVAPPSNSPLSPSLELMSEYRNDKITWDEFVVKYKQEMNTPRIEAMLLDVARKAVNEDIYLVCYDNKHNCHRFLLMDMIEELAKVNNIPLEIIKNKS